MRPSFVGSLAVLLLLSSSVRVAAQCPAGAPARNVAYTCGAFTPYVTHIGVCQAGSDSTGLPRRNCYPGCTVCFCGEGFHSVDPCDLPDSGPGSGDPDRPNSCQVTAGRASGPGAATLAIVCAGLAGWVGRRSAALVRARGRRPGPSAGSGA